MARVKKSDCLFVSTSVLNYFSKAIKLPVAQLIASLVMSFKPFGSVKVEWPGKADGRHLHHPPKGTNVSVFMICY